MLFPHFLRPSTLNLKSLPYNFISVTTFSLHTFGFFYLIVFELQASCNCRLGSARWAETDAHRHIHEERHTSYFTKIFSQYLFMIWITIIKAWNYYRMKKNRHYRKYRIPYEQKQADAHKENKLNRRNTQALVSKSHAATVSIVRITRFHLRLSTHTHRETNTHTHTKEESKRWNRKHLPEGRVNTAIYTFTPLSFIPVLSVALLSSCI